MEQLLCFDQPIFGDTPHRIEGHLVGHQKGVISRQTVGWLVLGEFQLRFANDTACGRQGICDLRSDVALHREDIFIRSIVALGPDVGACGRVNKLCRDANAIADRLQATRENIPHAQIGADLADVHGLALVNVGRVACDDFCENLVRLGQIGDDVLGYPVSDPFPLGIIAEAVERQDGNRGLIDRRAR